MNRRAFLRDSTVLGAFTVSGVRMATGQTPALIKRSPAKPVVIASQNGNVYRNGGNETCVQAAFNRMMQGADVLAALIAGVNIVELDPEECYVGYGGLPNADGVVQLDASCMHGPKKQAGAVAALEGVRTPSLVAKAVMEMTDHHLLVGKGAQTFARNMGFKIEKDLNTERSRKAWLEWKRKTDPKHYPDPVKRSARERQTINQMAAGGVIPSTRMHGTINCDGINAKGEICGVTSTSGLPFKIPGRVGDSPILGAGLYVDGNIGAAGSTGRGEANLFNLCSYLIVESLRRGLQPKDAGLEALRRIRANTVEKRLLKPNGDPNFNVIFYVLDAAGNHAGVALYGEDEDERSSTNQPKTRQVLYSFCDENGPQTVRCEPLLSGTSQR
ncbi:MAG TPA: N(4)-(beta-N-acetylglucosaminyl)-L-asparaginase [Verrucomicrobiae bacterium]